MCVKKKDVNKLVTKKPIKINIVLIFYEQSACNELYQPIPQTLADEWLKREDDG